MSQQNVQQKFWQQTLMRKYIKNVLVAIDQLANAMIGGDPDETISSRAAKRQDIWYWKVLGFILETVDPGHLKRSIEKDEGKDQLI